MSVCEADVSALSHWSELTASVLDELSIAGRTGRWSDRLAALRTNSFASFVVDCGLPAPRSIVDQDRRRVGDCRRMEPYRRA